MPASWNQALYKRLEQGLPAVLITQIGERGSSPRASGAKMLVTPEGSIDSLGGGHLEYQAILKAQELLAAGQDGVYEHSYTLSGQLGQCCGGEVRVLFEVFNTALPHLYLFGAGHVAQALVKIAAELPLQLFWIDDRDELFRQPVPTGVTRIERDPLDVAGSLPDGAWVLIMTHDHQLDFELLLQCLGQPQLAYLGMIGSQTKALRFRQRLEQRGITPSQIAQLHSPVGYSGLKTKRPMEIAVSVAADLIRRFAQQSEGN